MIRKLLLLAVVAVSLVSGVAVAQAAAKKHSVSESLAVRVLTSTSTGAVFTGIDKDKALGTGAVVVNATGTTPNVDTIVATAFFKGGSIKVKGTVTSTSRPDGSGFDFTGKAKAVSGTGVLKGVTGTLTLKGSSTSADPTYQTYKITGSLTY
jgi:hypothetical protein